MRIFLILFNFYILLFCNSLSAQMLSKSDILNKKVEIYKSIILFDKFKNKDFTLVSIQTAEVDFNKQFRNLPILTLQGIEDTVSVNKLSSLLPSSSYWIYQESNLDEFELLEDNIKNINYSKNKKRDLSDFNYIRIFEPLDKWKSLYFYFLNFEGGRDYEIIPVQYIRIKKYKILERKYLFLKVTYSYSLYEEIESIEILN